MESKITLSIITINWNNVNGLKKTMDSVISQMNNNCEYILVDGASSDGSQEEINKRKRHLSKIIIEPKSGIYSDMNKGIYHANGDYCLFLNSGDWLKPNVLHNIIQQGSGEDIIYFNTTLSYKDSTMNKELAYSKVLTMSDFYKRTINHQSTLIRRELFHKNGFYNSKNKIHSDYEFWIKNIIINNCTCKHVDESFSYYDMGGLSSKPDKASQLEVKNILKEYIPPRILKDYEDWHQRDKALQILFWYKNNAILYSILVVTYKVIKNIKKLFNF